MLKVELLNIARQFAIYLHQMPPYHFELIWDECSKKNSTFKVKDIRLFLEKTTNQVSSES